MTCKVNGTAREISNESTVFEAIVLRNGTNKRYEDIHFKDKDDLYLYFRSPVDGYVAVYLVDETPTAYCLLPYLNNRTGIHKVNSGKEYVFFDANGLKTNTDIDELSLSCDKDLDNYKMYVLFSPNPFTKAVDTMAFTSLRFDTSACTAMASRPSARSSATSSSATKKANEAAAYKAAPIKDNVSFEDFEKLDIRVGLIKDSLS